MGLLQEKHANSQAHTGPVPSREKCLTQLVVIWDKRKAIGRTTERSSRPKRLCKIREPTHSMTVLVCQQPQPFGNFHRSRPIIQNGARCPQMVNLVCVVLGIAQVYQVEIH